jgi:ABC-type antimicrobial peptide transport system permease subunit
MTSWLLIFRSLSFHARAHLGVLLGAAVGSAVLIGALVVGDSVRESLRHMALERLGLVHSALDGGDRLFRAALADSLQSRLQQLQGSNQKPSVAPMLYLNAVATRADGSARANHVHLYGIRSDITEFVPHDGFTSFSLSLGPEEVLLNQPLADQLGAKPGDQVLLRVRKPSALSREAPVSPQSDAIAALRLRVRAVVQAHELGNFSLRAIQVPPFNAFMRLDSLGEKLETMGQANLLITDAGQDQGRQLVQAWQLADAQLELRPALSPAGLELRSARIFLDPPIARAAFAGDTNASGIITYLVNLMRAGDRTTPYSMVTGAGPPWTPVDMRDDEILVNDWLAENLQVKPGDTLDLSYFLADAGLRLEERTNHFVVLAIVPISGLHADRTLMPEFPGLAKAESTHDWDAGFPLVHQIRPQDDQYWKQYRGTPKAFVTLNAGQRMWENRYGQLTAIRFAVPATATAAEFGGLLEQNLLSHLRPEELGLRFEPVRALALSAATQSQDFGQLFLGFSFFLIVAALLLTALLFQFGIEQRTAEVGTLLALGFQPKQVRCLLLAEGAMLAALGSALGMIGGIGYARAMLYGLSTIWRKAVSTSALHYHAKPLTLGIGVGMGAAVALFAMWLTLRKQARRPAHELLASGAEWGLDASALPPKTKARRSLTAATLAGVSGLFVLSVGALKTEPAAGAFFGSGALLLIAGISMVSSLFVALAFSGGTSQLTLSSLGIRNATRRRKRSLTTVAMLACGSFLIIAVGANRLETTRDVAKRSAGTGGFTLMAESALPVAHDLNSVSGREFYSLDEQALAEVSVVPMRMREGDEASCLNLNRAQTPRVLGVQPEALQTRGAFSFASVANGVEMTNGWFILKRKPISKNTVSQAAHNLTSAATDSSPTYPSDRQDVVPAIGDQASIVWALGKKVGDTIDYTDERGRTFKLWLAGALANSILQGSLVIAEDEFVARFPSASGYRMFLIDAPPERAASVAATLSRALQDAGLELTPTAQRLAAFNAVQNTYLSTFQILGGLGLLLGSAGLGVVVLRNVLERRGELALLLAVGFHPRALSRLALIEHGALLLLGLFVGAGSAVIAVLPVLLSPAAEVPLTSLAVTLAAVLVMGALSTWLSTGLALRGKLLEALRNE